MTDFVVDPAPGEAGDRNLATALLAALVADGPIVLTRSLPQSRLSARERALRAGASRAMVVLDQRAVERGRIWYDPERPPSMGLAFALSHMLAELGHHLPPHPCADHEVFGHRRRSAHHRPVVVVVAGADVPAPALAHALTRLAARLASGGCLPPGT